MKITVNGATIEVPDGTSISVSGGNVVVGGLTQFTYRDQVKVEVSGNCGNVQTASGDVVVSGSVLGSIQTASGDVKCGSVGGGIRTVSGDINL